MTGPRDLRAEFRAELQTINARMEKLSERLSKVEARMNTAIGGIGVLGVTAIVNLITNILQGGSGTQ